MPIWNYVSDLFVYLFIYLEKPLIFLYKNIFLENYYVFQFHYSFVFYSDDIPKGKQKTEHKEFNGGSG